MTPNTTAADGKAAGVEAGRFGESKVYAPNGAGAVPPCGVAPTWTIRAFDGGLLLPVFTKR